MANKPRLRAIFDSPAMCATSIEHVDSASQTANAWQLDFARKLLADRYGFWVSDSWSSQLANRLAARAGATGRLGIGDYLSFIQTSEGTTELVVLLESLLNGESHFLRTEPHFGALMNTILPAWRASHVRGQRFRIASLGCSSGEEPYSISLVLHEQLTDDELADVEISAIDLSSRALAAARAGSYDDYQLRDLSPARRNRWFKHEKDRWVVNAALRSSVRFLQHNLLDPLPFAGLDVIFCRNVLIYFKAPVVAACFAEFHAALRPGGYLILGHSESAFGFPEFFEPLQIPDGVIYQNKPANPFIS